MNEVNVILDILKEMVKAHPSSVFINSLYQQYCNRGGLSKKQLEGLYSKASKTGAIPSHKLATLEAIIKKKPTRERAAASKQVVLPTNDMETGKILEAIIAKYPLHKRVLYLRSKYDNNEMLDRAELDEIRKFSQLLLKEIGRAHV
jgi:hypothetical protein